MADLKVMAAELAANLKVRANREWSEWSQLHGNLAEIAAGAGGDDARTAVQALLKVAKDASSSQALMRALEERVSKANLKYLVSLVAHQLSMTPLGDSAPVHMVDEDGNFCEGNVDLNINCSPELSAPNAPYAVVSIVGAQSSGKSYLLNRLFGTRFPEMDATRGWNQTTRGIMMSRCIRPSLLLLDAEGFDGIQKGQDTLFEKQVALFALTVSDLMIVNMIITDISRVEGGGTLLFRTIFQERTKIKGGGLTKILVVLRRDSGETGLEILRQQVLRRLQETWESVNVESMKFKDYIEVDVFRMSSKGMPNFPEEVTELRRLLSNIKFAKVPVSCFTASSRIFWNTIKQNKKLDIPSHQVLIDSLYCQRLVEDILNSLDSREDYKRLKVEECPSSFKKLAYAILEATANEYNEETKMYADHMRAKECERMEERLNKIFTKYCRKLIWKMKEQTFHSLKVKLKEEIIEGMKEDEADAHGIQIVNACAKEFKSSCEDLMVFDSDFVYWICGDLEKQLQSDTDVHILKIKKEIERKEQEIIKTASLALQALGTGLNLGSLGLNIFSLANGNGSG